MLVTYPRCHEVHEGTYGADGGGKKWQEKSEGYKVGFPGVVAKKGVSRASRDNPVWILQRYS